LKKPGGGAERVGVAVHNRAAITVGTARNLSSPRHDIDPLFSFDSVWKIHQYTVIF
jgi:hypothetical protein